MIFFHEDEAKYEDERVRTWFRLLLADRPTSMHLKSLYEMVAIRANESTLAKFQGTGRHPERLRLDRLPFRPNQGNKVTLRPFSTQLTTAMVQYYKVEVYMSRVLSFPQKGG